MSDVSLSVSNVASPPDARDLDGPTVTEIAASIDRPAQGGTNLTPSGNGSSPPDDATRPPDDATTTPSVASPESAPASAIEANSLNAGISTSAADLGGPLSGSDRIVAPPPDVTPPVAGGNITTSPAQRTDRIQAEQIQLGNTGRVELVPSTPVGNLRVNVRADVTLPNPPLDSRVDANPPAGDGDRQFTTGTFNLRTTAVTPEKTVVVGAVGVSVDPSKDQPVRSVSPGLEIYQLGENNGLGGATGRVTFSRSATDELYPSGANVSGRVQLNASTDVFAGPNFGFSQPGRENGGSVGGTVGIVQRSEYGQNTVRQTTTSVTVAVPEAGGVTVTGAYSNGERNRFLGTDPDTSITVQYSNRPGVDSRFQIGVQFFNLP